MLIGPKEPRLAEDEEMGISHFSPDSIIFCIFLDLLYWLFSYLSLASMVELMGIINLKLSGINFATSGSGVWHLGFRKDFRYDKYWTGSVQYQVISYRDLGDND